MTPEQRDRLDAAVNLRRYADDQMTNEAKDEAKAWTCATHILLESKTDRYFEQFLRDKTGDAFDAQMFSSLGDGTGP